MVLTSTKNNEVQFQFLKDMRHTREQNMLRTFLGLKLKKTKNIWRLPSKKTCIWGMIGKRSVSFSKEAVTLSLMKRLSSYFYKFYKKLFVEKKIFFSEFYICEISHCFTGKKTIFTFTLQINENLVFFKKVKRISFTSLVAL